MIETKFEYPSGKSRPQILLVGKGMERKSGQREWSELLKLLIADDTFHLTKELQEEIPFPLLYQLLSTRLPAPAHLSSKTIQDEERRLADAMLMQAVLTYVVILLVSFLPMLLFLAALSILGTAAGLPLFRNKQ